MEDLLKDFKGKEKTYSKSPTLIDGLDYKKIVSYSCGSAHILAVSSDSKVFAWGDGTYGKLGMHSWV